MADDVIILPSEPQDNREAEQFADWVKEKAKELQISEDYFILEFI